MTDQTIGFTGAALFIGAVCYAIHLTTKWGAETKAREAEEEKSRTSIVTPAEDGTLIRIESDPTMVTPQQLVLHP